MNKEVSVKVCGMTRAVDVEQALSLGADYIGFIVYPKSPRAVELERAAQLSLSVPKGKRVVVDVEPNPVGLRRYRDAGFDYFQIHVNASVEEQLLADYSTIVGRDQLWLAPRLAPSDSFPERLFKYAKTILMDTYSRNQIGGTGETGDFGRFAELKNQFPDITWILAGGLNAFNVSEALRESTTSIIDVSSGVESEPGVKDAKKLRNFFKAALNKSDLESSE